MLNREVGFALVVLISGAILLASFNFSRSYGLDFSTGASIIGWCSFALIIAIWSLASPILGFFSFRLAWPLCLCIVWYSLWPALAIWGAEGPAIPVEYIGFGMEQSLKWWAEWYTRWAVLIGILLVGYGTLAKD